MLLKRIRQCLPWFWLAFCVGSFLLFLHQNLLTMLEADMASEMVLGNHLAQSGKWLSSEWYYGSELRLLSPPAFFSLFFPFVEKWHWVRLLGTLSLYAFMLACFYYLCYQLNQQKHFPIAASVFFFPLSEIYAYINLIGIYYLPYAGITFCVLGMIIQYQTTTKKSMRFFLLCLLAFFSTISGITSLRMILLLFIPAFFASLLIFYSSRRNSSVFHSSRLLVFSSLGLLFSVAGHLMSSLFLSKTISFLRYEKGIVFTSIRAEPVLTVLNDWLYHLGYQNTGSLFSVSLLRAVLCLSLFILILHSFYCCLYRKSHLFFTASESLPILTYFFGMVLLTLLLMFTTTLYSPNYLVPSLVLTPITILLFFSKCKLHRTIKKITVSLLLTMIVICGIDTCHTYNHGEDCYELQQISASLVQDGYTEGYSTFWRGNLVTELSDGKLDLRVWDAADNMDITSVSSVLQFKSHEITVPQGKTFIILSKYLGEHTDIPLATWLQSEDIYWDSKDFLVYGYESYDTMLNSFNESINQDLDRLTLAPMAATSLSSIPLYPGSYTVAIKGEQLNDLEITCKHSQGMLTPSFANHSDGLLTFQLDSSDLLHDLQINLRNDGNQSSVLNSFQLEKNSSR